jgi:tetraprenyl-beta-curcumene synthase
VLATLRTLIVYEALIVPHARREIRRWARVAAAIPDPVLRAHATGSIAVDASNAEAVAAFAAIAPRRLRRTTTELLVTYQLLVDYVDTLGERVCADRLLAGLAIGSALPAAVATPASPIDLDPLGDDGGYLVALVATCRSLLWQLPAAAGVARQAHVAAVRCGDALAHTHTAAEHESIADLRAWASAQADAADYSWWEVAAGGNSSIAILALLGTAADAQTTERFAGAVADAYWPHVCVMSTMLDSLVDYERDADTGDFSFVSHYPEHDAARRGLVDSATNSLAATQQLRHSGIHTMIVCGVAGYYAAAAAPGTLAAGIAPRLLQALRPAVTPIALALRLQHGIGVLRRAERAA